MCQFLDEVRNVEFLALLQVQNGGNILKECEIGPTIREKSRPDNYWSDQNFECIRL